MNYENKLFDLDEELDNVEDWVQAIPPVKWFNERIKAGKKPYSNYYSGKVLLKAINKVKASVDKVKYDELMRIKGYLYRLHPDLDPKRI